MCKVSICDWAALAYYIYEREQRTCNFVLIICTFMQRARIRWLPWLSGLEGCCCKGVAKLSHGRGANAARVFAASKPANHLEAFATLDAVATRKVTERHATTLSGDTCSWSVAVFNQKASEHRFTSHRSKKSSAGNSKNHKRPLCCVRNRIAVRIHLFRGPEQLEHDRSSGSSRKFCHRGILSRRQRRGRRGTRASLPALVNPSSKIMQRRGWEQLGRSSRDSRCVW